MAKLILGDVVGGKVLTDEEKKLIEKRAKKAGTVVKPKIKGG